MGSWHLFLAAISHAVERLGTDVQVLHTCLDSLAFGSTLAIVLSLAKERKAFAELLAKVTFVERHRGTADEEHVPTWLVNNEHLQQDWSVCDRTPLVDIFI